MLAKNLLSVQRPEGNAMHQYAPLALAEDTGSEANEGDSREKASAVDSKGNHLYADWYGDDHLWIVLTVASYLKETGKMDLLKEEIPFYEKGKKHAERARGTILEHLKRSLNFTRTHLGKHGLPLLGFADWNDCMNLPLGAESTFNTALYAKALLEMMDIEEQLGDGDGGAESRADRFCCIAGAALRLQPEGAVTALGATGDRQPRDRGN